MNVWMLDAAREALALMDDHAQVVCVRNTDESTFRSFFLRSLLTYHKDWDCDSEWSRVDLLVRGSGEKAFIEFKYYLSKPRRMLDGKQKGFKGGAGKKNEAEFQCCIEQLHTTPYGPVDNKYVVLVYEQNAPDGVKSFYDDSYGVLTVEGPVVAIERLEARLFRCAILAIE